MQISNNDSTQSPSLPTLEKLSDKELYRKCRLYGAEARLWRQKFIGLLPEVNRRRLYEKKGFSSIFEFAFKLCGLSAEQVRLALNLEKRFEDKPALKKMLENGEASINKLTRVVAIATKENEKELAEKIKILPKSALETLVRDEKITNLTDRGVFTNENQNGLQKALFDSRSLPGQTLQFELADDVAEELNELHSKGIDVNEFLRGILKKRKEEIGTKKAEISQNIQQTNSRHIPAETRRLLEEEFGEKCSLPSCRKPAETIHHTQRFSLSQNHDPRFLAPLCREHHVIAHSIDLKYQHARAENFG